MVHADGVLHTPPPGQGASSNRMLAAELPEYVSLVKLHITAPGKSNSSREAKVGRVNATQAQKLLCAKFQTLSEQASSQLEWPESIASMHEAFEHLEIFDPPNAGATGQTKRTTIEAAEELERLLVAEGSIQEQDAKISNIRGQLGSHGSRAAKLRTEVTDMLDRARCDLERRYDPKFPKPLDAKLFEALTCPQMDNLLTAYAGELKMNIDRLKAKVKEKMDMIFCDAPARPGLFQCAIKDRSKNKEVADVLEQWKFFEPLTSLPAFAQLPGAGAFDQELEAHCAGLQASARSVILTQGATPQMAAKPILLIGKFGSDVPRALPFANEALQVILNFAEPKFQVSGMQALATEMRRLDATVANEIIGASDAFVALVITEFNEKTKRDISVVKDLFSKVNPDIEYGIVWSKFSEFEAKYDSYLQECVGGLDEKPDMLNYLVRQATSLVIADQGKRDQLYGARQFVGLTKGQQNIPQVLAAIFAWWTLDFYLERKKRNPGTSSSGDTAAKLRHANNGQVVCLLRLLGATQTGSVVDLQNHLSQIDTGEGKSVIIGVLSTTLALYGYAVDCVCYSSMLSSRDFDDFSPMFKGFGLEARIRYGTFDTLSEKIVKENHGDLRQMASEFLKTGKATIAQPPASPPRILIIDEVDVFCDKEFFGGAYTPLMTLKHPSISELMRHVWSLRNGAMSMAAVKTHTSYKAVMGSGLLCASNEWLLERSVLKMHEAARSYKPGTNAPYTMLNGDILYKVEGRDDYAAWSFMYETNVEYLHEFGRGKLTEQQLSSNLALHVRCGEFAYARLPAIFAHILGVTGTLDPTKLPPDMLDILRTEIKVKHQTICPSMYHAQKRDFHGLKVGKDEHEHFHLMVDELDLRLKSSTGIEGQRSVIIFFTDEQVLQRFRASSYFKKHEKACNVLTELTAQKRVDREAIVKAATRQGVVTLATRIYGRGTDFKIFDDRMEDCGGMHVISSFFSSDLSEEVQIKGRTARQGCRGSWSMVLEIGALCKQFDIKTEAINAWKPGEVYDKLNAHRTAASKGEVQALRQLAQTRTAEHNVLVNALKGVKAGIASAFQNMLQRYNSAGSLNIGSNGLHIVCCLDESYSMQGKDWDELVGAFQRFWQQMQADGAHGIVSVVQFGHRARVTHARKALQGSPPALEFGGGATAFLPPVQEAIQLIRHAGPQQNYTPVVVFMSDGGAADAAQAAQALEQVSKQMGDQFMCYTVGFGSGASRTLESMAFANGERATDNYKTADVGSLSDAFKAVATSLSPGRLS